MSESSDHFESLAPPRSDDGVFVSLLLEHRHRIYAYIAKMLPNPADAEDVFQRTSIVLWNKISQYDPSGDFFYWACGVAFYEIKNFLRVQSRDRLYFDDELLKLIGHESREQGEASECRRKALGKCISNLPEEERELVQKCYDGTTDMGQVASSLGRTRNAIYKQLGRIRRKLFACIERRIEQEGTLP